MVWGIDNSWSLLLLVGLGLVAIQDNNWHHSKGGYYYLMDKFQSSVHKALTKHTVLFFWLEFYSGFSAISINNTTKKLTVVLIKIKGMYKKIIWGWNCFSWSNISVFCRFWGLQKSTRFIPVQSSQRKWSATNKDAFDSWTRRICYLLP